MVTTGVVDDLGQFVVARRWTDIWMSKEHGPPWADRRRLAASTDTPDEDLLA